MAGMCIASSMCLCRMFLMCVLVEHEIQAKKGPAHQIIAPQGHYW